MTPQWLFHALLAALGLTACSPTLDWREIRPDETDIVAMFPCRPDRHARSVVVAASRVRMRMLVCEAGGATYALSVIDVAEPAAATAALDDLRAVALSNLGAAGPSRTLPLSIPGMTPSPQATRLAVLGRLPNGTTVQAQTAFFFKASQVCQASVIGATLSAEALDTYFSGIRFAS